MNFFKTKGVIIKIHKVGEKDFLYTIFTEDFGKIICQKKLSKTEKTLDLGYIINFEIETKEGRSIHKIRHIKISSELRTTHHPFSIINSYLELLATVHKNCPEGLKITNIISMIEILHNKENLEFIHIILAKLKLNNILGTLGLEDNNETVQKILKFINENPFSRIVKLTGISKEITSLLNSLSFAGERNSTPPL